MRQRQHIGEGKGGGIAGTRLLADAGPIEDRDVAPRLGQIGGGADADDAAADDGDVFPFSPFTGEKVPDGRDERAAPRFCRLGIPLHVGAAPHLAAVIFSPMKRGEEKPQNVGSFGRTASASLTIFSTALRRSPDSGWRGMRTRSLVLMANTSASLMFCTR